VYPTSLSFSVTEAKHVSCNERHSKMSAHHESCFAPLLVRDSKLESPEGLESLRCVGQIEGILSMYVTAILF